MKSLSPQSVERLGFALLLSAALGAAYSLVDAMRPERMLTIAVKEGVEGVALKKAAERFSKERGVSVKIKELPYNDLFNEELKQVGGDPPSEFDLVMVDDPWMPALLAAGTSHAGTGAEAYRLKKLEKETYMQDDGLDDFVKSSLRVATLCSHDDPCDDYYGVPYVGNSQLLCYNPGDFQVRDLQTWDDIKRASVKLKEGRLAYVTRVGSSNSIVTDFLPILSSYDDKSFPPQLDPKLGAFGQKSDNTKDAIAAFVSMAELVRKQKASGVSVDDFDVAAFLAEGRASMGIVWSAWAMSLVSVVNADKSSDQGAILRCSNPPAQPPELGVWLLAIPSTARMGKQAEEFIKYATSREQFLIAATEGNPPPRRSVVDAVNDLPREDEIGHTRPAQCSRETMPASDYRGCLARRIRRQYGDLFESQLQSLEQARPRPRTRCWREMEKALGDHLQNLIAADEGSSESLRQAAEQAFSQARDTIDPLIQNCPSLQPGPR